MCTHSNSCEALALFHGTQHAVLCAEVAVAIRREYMLCHQIPLGVPVTWSKFWVKVKVLHGWVESGSGGREEGAAEIIANVSIGSRETRKEFTMATWRIPTSCCQLLLVNWVLQNAYLPGPNSGRRLTWPAAALYSFCLQYHHLNYQKDCRILMH